MAAHESAPRVALAVAILTFSDTRTLETDESGQLIERLLASAGHTVLSRLVVREDTETIRQALTAALGDAQVQALITTGGTGVSLRDLTPECVAPLLAKQLEGFGELFRMLSFHENRVGSKAMLSRALGGVTASGKIVFCLPGSRNAVDLGMTRLILPELGHIYRELTK